MKSFFYVKFPHKKYKYFGQLWIFSDGNSQIFLSDYSKGILHYFMSLLCLPLYYFSVYFLLCAVHFVVRNINIFDDFDNKLCHRQRFMDSSVLKLVKMISCSTVPS